MSSNRRRSYVVTCDEEQDVPSHSTVNSPTRTYVADSSPLHEGIEDLETADSISPDDYYPTTQQLQNVSARYDSGSEKQAPKLIKKLKKQMDIVIDNFDKISKEHLCAKEELDKIIKEESELAYELEKVQDSIHESLYGSKSDYGIKYGCQAPNEYLGNLLKSLDSYVTCAKTSAEPPKDHEFFKLYNILICDIDCMEKYLNRLEGKVSILTSEMKTLDGANQDLLKVEDRLRRDCDVNINKCNAKL